MTSPVVKALLQADSRLWRDPLLGWILLLPFRRIDGVVVRWTRRGPRCGIIVIPLSRDPLAMANLLVRNLDDAVLQQLKAAAKAHGRSLQAEIHEVLRNASARRLAETRRLSARWLKRLRGSTQSDSAALIREDRDTR